MDTYIVKTSKHSNPMVSTSERSVSQDVDGSIPMELAPRLKPENKTSKPSPTVQQ